tara:strand:- start:166 stop:372 length:207 start_codon:yes stop_codon:yes gene_type:complete
MEMMGLQELRVQLALLVQMAMTELQGQQELTEMMEPLAQRVLTAIYQGLLGQQARQVPMELQLLSKGA